MNPLVGEDLPLSEVHGRRLWGLVGDGLLEVLQEVNTVSVRSCPGGRLADAPGSRRHIGSASTRRGGIATAAGCYSPGIASGCGTARGKTC